ncbi:hypothetical protein KIN20_019286 [Parelaphostrongylus tenuis]|uniref:Uncharacterized protein n=1 Tax=Parelaphostrongylus tenuis TaxID=148309 RepID=A0AAD5QS94_PARTN|nr:hypothetical protein KIN20_019286 [Parelaphostrongylus tenuis]
MPVVFAKVPGIAPNKGTAQALVSHLVMQTVFDVLENQSRSAVLPDAVILNFGSTRSQSRLRSNVTLEGCSKSDGRRKNPCVNYKHHYGKLFDTDMAKCSEQSDSNAGIGSVWIAFLLRN